MAYKLDEEKDQMRKEILDELNDNSSIKSKEGITASSFGRTEKKKIVNFDNDEPTQVEEGEIDTTEGKGTNKVFLLICGILVIIGIYFFPRISKEISKIKFEKDKKIAQNSKEEKKEEEKQIPKLTLNDSKVTNLIYPIYHIDSSVKNTYYSKDKVSLNNLSNLDLQINAMANFSDILYTNYTGGYNGTVCTNNKIAVDSKYFPIQVNNLYTKNTKVSNGDITIPTNTPTQMYSGLWKFDSSKNIYVYYGDCKPKNTNILYYDLRYTYEVDNSDKNIDLYTFNYVAFATVDKTNKNYVIYSDTDYTKEITKGTLKTNNYNTELNNILKEFANKDSLRKYKYTFSITNCPYQEYCFESGEWIK